MTTTQNPGTTRAPSTGPVAAPPPRHERYALTTAAVIAIGMCLSILDTAIVGIDYTAITREIGGSQVDVQWVSTAFRASTAMVIPAVPWLCGRLGHRRVFLLAMVLYAVGSAWCGIAGSLPELVAARVLQAVPGAATPVVCLLIFNRLMPKDKLAIALSLYVVVIVGGFGFAPFVGGLLAQYASWRAIFFLTVPLSMIGLAFGALLLPPMPGGPHRRFDWPGYLSISIGLTVLLIALNKGQDWGWTSYRILIMLAVGVDLLALFVYLQLRPRDPLLDLNVFRNRAFVIGLIIFDVLFTGVFVVLSDIPVFLITAQGLPLSNAGYVLLPQGLAWVASVPLVVWLNNRYGSRLLPLTGILLLGVGSLAFVALNVDMPRSWMMVWLTVRGLGLGFATVPLLGGSVARLPQDLVPDGLAIRLNAQRVFSGMGVGVLTSLTSTLRAQTFSDHGALLTPDKVAADPRIQQLRQTGLLGQYSQQLQYHATAQAYSDVFLITGVLTLLCIPLVFLARWTPPAEGPVPPGGEVPVH